MGQNHPFTHFHPLYPLKFGKFIFIFYFLGRPLANSSMENHGICDKMILKPKKTLRQGTSKNLCINSDCDWEVPMLHNVLGPTTLHPSRKLAMLPEILFCTQRYQFYSKNLFDGVILVERIVEETSLLLCHLLLSSLVCRNRPYLLADDILMINIEVFHLLEEKSACTLFSSSFLKQMDVYFQ